MRHKSVYTKIYERFGMDLISQKEKQKMTKTRYMYMCARARVCVYMYLLENKNNYKNLTVIVRSISNITTYLIHFSKKHI